ncbi:MAG: Eco57I restriction-modification methylase domain-containing protein, partial [Sediminibacterium sp.]|nr:Eco57I restriction-modification methylase domain-containing protein [Sediminibacterium sp.]
DLNQQETSFAEKNAYKIIDALETVKICDPAIGSGAFPMGLLQEIFHIQIYLQELKGFKKNVSDAQIKKHIIEESIYGVDIDSGAVDIARLRFWLSLVVDEVAPQPLPNLAFKIVCANTLIPLGKPKSDLSGSLDIAKAIEKLRHDYFDASKEDKKDLERQFKNLQNKLWATAKEWVSKEDSDIYLKISEFNPFEDKSCTWFDAWWMFGIKDGFDIVIGNPPYVNIANIKDEDYRNRLRATFYSAKNKADLYAFFLEKGFELLKPTGILSYIIPQTWKATDSFSKLREIIFKEKSVLVLVDLEFGVFDAIVKPMIILILNERNKYSSFNVLDSTFKKLTDVKIADILNDATLSLNTNFSESQKEIFKIIELNSLLLDNFVKFSRGIKTSDDSRFINTIKKNEEYKKIFRGKNIRSYQLNWNEEYIWYRPDLMKEKIGSVSYTKDFFEVPEKIVTQRVNSSMRLLCTYDNSQNYFLDTTNLSRFDSWDGKTSLKLLCGLLNSKVINYWYCNKYLMPTIGIYELHTIPIKIPNNPTPFITLVDYLLYLHNKVTPQILTQITNQEIASHLEDILNMMVYELYFEEHMKEVGIDVLQFINPPSIGLSFSPTQIK